MSVLTSEPKSRQTQDCGCVGTIPVPEPGLTVGIATVPMQPWESVYEPGKGLRQGTIFPCLDMPFYVMEKGWDVKAKGWGGQSTDRDRDQGTLSWAQKAGKGWNPGKGGGRNG